MSVLKRNHISIRGKGTTPLMFAHGFGCDQNMWRFVAPAFEDDYKVILFDHVGAGNSDLSAYSKQKYESLNGYADDIVQIIQELDLTGVIFVGHSVSAMMGVMAAISHPQLFKALVLVSPSASYINDGDYIGGFTKPEIDELLVSLDHNHMGWSMAMAPVIMGNPNRQELGEELTSSFCRTNPDIAIDFARATFLTDSRSILASSPVPAFILQCTDDVIAPEQAGKYVHDHMPGSNYVLLTATGHCPNLSAPEETTTAIKKYLATL